MALKAPPISVYRGNNKKNIPCSQLGILCSAGGRFTLLNSRFQREWEWECLCHRAIVPVEDDVASAPGVAEEASQITHATRFHKDLSSLPSEFTVLHYYAKL